MFRETVQEHVEVKIKYFLKNEPPIWNKCHEQPPRKSHFFHRSGFSAPLLTYTIAKYLIYPPSISPATISLNSSCPPEYLAS